MSTKTDGTKHINRLTDHHHDPVSFSDAEIQRLIRDIVYTSEDLDYQIIADQLRKISEANYVVVNIFDDNGLDFTTVAISGLSDTIRKASKFLGFQIIGKHWNSDPVLEAKTHGRSITRFNNISELSGKMISKSAVDLLQATFDIGEVLVAKIEKDVIVQGDFTIIMPAGKSFRQHELVEFYTHQIGLLINRHRAERALRKSEAKFRDLFDKDLTGNFISTVNGEFILINEAFARIFGFETVEEMMKDRAEVTYANDGDRERFVNLVRKKRRLDLFEETLKRRDGREIVVLENVIGEFDEKDQLVRLKGYVIDITDRKVGENRLRDSERLLKESQEISRIGSYTLDIRNGLWKGSEVLDAMFGISPNDDHSVKGWLSVVLEDDRESMTNYFNHDVLEKRGRFDREYRILPRNSDLFLWVHGIGEVEFDENGSPLKMIGTIQDISERKRSEEALRRSEELFKSVVYNSLDLTTLTDENEKLLFVSPQCQNILGFEGDKYLGQRMPFKIFPDDRDHALQLWSDLKKSGKVIRDFQYRIITEDGKLRWLSHSAKQVFLNDKFLGIQSTIRDISNSKRMEEELLSAKERAEASDRLKTAFLNNISHEVRTPLNGILGFGEMLMNQDLTPETKAFYFEILNSSSDRLLSTINDYMDISLISSGNIEVRASLFNLMDLISAIRSKYLPLAEKKGLNITMEVQGLPKSYLLDTDGNLLTKIISQLVDNAIKYSSAGTIEIGCLKKAGELEFFVKDQGIGISPDKLENIFENFIQEDISLTRKYDGSGLGLSIAKGFVELLGGRIWAESEKGYGSIFRFTVGSQS